MFGLSQDATLEHEKEIRWMEDPDRFDYVRERWATAGTRTKPVPWEGKSQGEGRMVGYAILGPDAPSYSPGKFFRRVFVVCDHDRSETHDTERGPYDEGTAPIEGIDPDSVAPGVSGEQSGDVWPA